MNAGPLAEELRVGHEVEPRVGTNALERRADAIGGPGRTVDLPTTTAPSRASRAMSSAARSTAARLVSPSGFAGVPTQIDHDLGAGKDRLALVLEREPPGGDLLVDELGEAGLEERWLAAPQHVDLLGVGIDRRDIVTERRERRGRDEPDVPGADDPTFMAGLYVFPVGIPEAPNRTSR